jgi:hypothetical protein
MISGQVIRVMAFYAKTKYHINLGPLFPYQFTTFSSYIMPCLSDFMREFQSSYYYTFTFRTSLLEGVRSGGCSVCVMCLSLISYTRMLVEKEFKRIKWVGNVGTDCTKVWLESLVLKFRDEFFERLSFLNIKGCQMEYCEDLILKSLSCPDAMSSGVGACWNWCVETIWV